MKTLPNIRHRIGEKIPQEDGTLKVIEACPRCGGSGSYSYCTMYGTTCFKCSGSGVVVKHRTVKNQLATEKRRAKAEEKRQAWLVQNEARMAEERERAAAEANAKEEAARLLLQNPIWICAAKKTFDLKETLKADYACRWHGPLKVWYTYDEPKDDAVAFRKTIADELFYVTACPPRLAERMTARPVDPTLKVRITNHLTHEVSEADLPLDQVELLESLDNHGTDYIIERI